MGRFGLQAVAALAAAALATTARADDLRQGGKLLLTGGVTSIEGAGGGGLATWATTTGYGTKEGVGANVHATYVHLSDYELRSVGAAVGIADRVELSYARQAFDTGKTGAALGIGRGFTFHQDVFGAKVRLAGDAIYDQDRWLPQVAAGVQVKHADREALVKALGAKNDDGVDYYLAFTKVLLNESLVLNGTVRATKANQTGLLGFGGDRDGGYSAQFEGTAGVLVSKRLLVGGEYRTKPNNLGFAKEEDAFDLFAAFALNKHLSLTGAYVAMGDIATFRNQRGVYLSLQAGF